MTHPKFERNFSKFRTGLNRLQIPARFIFIIMGVLSTLWFLFRVIPKPSRAGYPCMRAAFPIMAGFIVWILGVTGSIVAFREAKKRIVAGKYLLAAALIIAGVSFGITALVQNYKKAMAADNYVDNSYFVPNQPAGEGYGPHPGRVVWVFNPDATDENAANTQADPFYITGNNNQTVISQMFEDAIMLFTSEKTLDAAWDQIFENFNLRKHGVRQSYSNGETIFIKINEGTSSWAANNADLSRASWYTNISAETTPFSVYALLDHLVNTVGVPQDMIWVGDPRSHVWKYTYDYLSADFPNVHYADKDASRVNLGRSTIHPNTDPIMFYSDKGTVMTGATTDKYFNEMTDADYLIDLAALKAHARAGITLTAKNHFGSHTREAASHLHPALVAPENDTPLGSTTGYGKYRVFVDILGHERVGRNTLLFFIDGLWGGPEATVPPGKFTSEPFDNDWSNSLFIAQDPVALESVCFDILRHEYNNPDDKTMYRPHMFGADDYLHQAADQANWPAGIVYDPEDDGSPVPGLGVHEHWNSYPYRQYSRNLGIPSGIELLTIPEDLSYSFPFVARKVTEIPVIDGESTDNAWSEASWYPIDKTWINWGEIIPEDDFSGRFKIVWNENENLIYMFVEITDDAFIDGYVYPDGGYPDYDIVEVFIDEDRSGGLHVFDNSTTWGKNAENAFSYHIAVNSPADGQTESAKVVCDIKGTTWGNIANYADHFPGFIMKKTGNTYSYEYSMKVYSDAYDQANPEASRVSLELGKVMGLSVAYCDNDQNDGSRDNFFGSVWVTEEAYNDHWMNCDDYGKLALGDVDGSVPVVIKQNMAPDAIGTIDDYYIQEIGINEVVVEDVNTLFSDPDGDELTFTVTDSSPLLSSHFYGDQLRVRGLTGFTGSAEVTLTASDGRLTRSIKFNAIYDKTGIQLNKIEKSLKLYPVPVTDQLSFSFSSEDYGKVGVRILNLNGQVIETAEFMKSMNEFSGKIILNKLEPGLYLVELSLNNTVAVRRFMK